MNVWSVSLPSRIRKLHHHPVSPEPVLLRRVYILPILLACFCWLAPASAGTVVLRVPYTPEGNHAFFYEVLKTAFAAVDHPVELHSMTGPGKERFKMMLHKDELDVMWMVRGPKRDKLFVPVDFPLTGGLIGKRILLIRPGEQERFDRIKSLDDFKQLSIHAGMGRDWVDADIWRANDLPVTSEAPDWRLLFKMLASGNRKIDYIPRGASEILADAAAHPDLLIEQRLLLQYERDSVFYLSPSTAMLAPLLKRGLIKLRADGTYARLLEKHFGTLSRQLRLSQRKVLLLRDIEDPTN